MNFVGTVYPTKALIGRMKSRGEGSVVITGSVASLLGIYGFSIYSGTKFALRGFAEALHMEVYHLLHLIPTCVSFCNVPDNLSCFNTHN